MKTLLALVSALLLASAVTLGGTCTTGPLSGYIGASCTLPGGQVLDFISYTGIGTNPVAASAITLTPGSQGFTLTSSDWNVSGGETSEGNFIFSATGTFNNAGLAIGGTRVSGGGMVGSDEIISDAVMLMVTTTGPLSDFTSIPQNTGTLIFDKDLALTANGGSASMTSLNEAFLQTTSTVPESSTMLLSGFGLLVIGVWGLRAKRNHG